MIEIIIQVFGTTFAGIILICVVFTLGDYIIEDIKMKRKWED